MSALRRFWERLGRFFTGLHQFWLVMIDLSISADHRDVRMFYRYAETLKNQQNQNRNNAEDLAVMREMIASMYSDGVHLK